MDNKTCQKLIVFNYLLKQVITSQQHFMKMFLQQNNDNLPIKLIAHNGKQWPTTSTCDVTLWLSRTTDNSNFLLGPVRFEITSVDCISMI